MIISSHCDILDDTIERIGLLADSHGNNSLLLDSVKRLKAMDAQIMIHLGDICDVQTPYKIDEAVEILETYGVKGVMGNNESSIISGLHGNFEKLMKDDTILYLERLPYILRMGGFYFAHSTPFNWPAATRRPVTEYIYQLAGSKQQPFRALFRGHSHSQSVIEIKGEKVKEIHIKPEESIALYDDRVYVITVGAVEDGLFALFIPEQNEMKFCEISKF